MNKIRKQDALDYHSSGRKGKLEVIPSKPYSSQRDLSLAYSPGVAEPCLAIAENREDVYKYTTKGNLVAVISNGTAVLGLGDIGPEASKPVMEGKGLLFKIFADIDVFDIEVDASDVDRFVETVKAIAPTFGGINLEDIKAPEAFEIEKRLVEELDIPIMHDDQHGTAIISAAALLNALELAEKNIEDVRIVVSGAGAAAISCLDLYVRLGAKLENIAMFDSKGHINTSRDNLDERKSRFATEQAFTDLGDALKDADVFLGLSKGGIVNGDMIKSMTSNPIVFALANPDPEIGYEEAMATRDDVIMATGRSDHPNQVNNVLGFPYIFRGALDVRATCINMEMKLAAVQAIARLAKEPVPDEVNEAYDMRNIAFGRDLIIPKPLDPRLITEVASAVAKAAIDSGVAKYEIDDWGAYKQELIRRLGRDNKLIRSISERARKRPKRVVFAEGDSYKILKAAEQASDERIAFPVLLGSRDRIENMIKENSIELTDYEIIDPRHPEEAERLTLFAEKLFAKRQRKGMTLTEARKAMRDRNYFGAMMVETGDADALVSGLTRNYRNVIRPALQIIGMEEGVEKVAGMYIIDSGSGPIFFADTTVNADPTWEELVDITLLVAKTVRRMRMTPKIAMLSYSNFGSAYGKDSNKMRKAAAFLQKHHPDLIVDGEIQANFALNNEMIAENFPFSTLRGRKVNTLIFPNLAAGNIAYKLMQEMGDKEVIGPLLLGMKKSFHVLQMGSSVREIINMVRIAVVDAQNK
ncbi:NADP-dependent malic enzyme [Sanyastnella coralliicola]|uniref:NADP-dependent malic enzyme n=1 Tax=Sanyastnella coralliicola TaxID=3069118 RepID=UPI0027BA22A8|nr:NADP-dependent malic enzyme [Longitalea sp. SCSIO 12813]